MDFTIHCLIMIGVNIHLYLIIKELEKVNETLESINNKMKGKK